MIGGEWQIRREIVEYARRTYERRLVAATDGNLSHRLGRDRVLVTPSGSCLGELKPEDLVCVSSDGRALSGDLKPTSELPMHLAVYATRADVNAIVHAHPPITNAFSYAGRELDVCVIPEMVVSLGRVPTTEYATPSSEENARVVTRMIREHDALILQRHGSLTVGPTMRDAYFKTEKLEHAAEVLLAARQLGKVIPLNADEVQRLADVCERHGWRPRDFILGACKRESR